jgi:hypothetical protein
MKKKSVLLEKKEFVLPNLVTLFLADITQIVYAEHASLEKSRMKENQF